MRRIRYQVACSLDGYIADAEGRTDWIPPDPEIDFEALFAQFDTLLMGRRTYEDVDLSGPLYRGKHIVVVSRTLEPEAHPGVTVVADNIAGAIDELRARRGKDIWLFGGGQLLRSLLALNRVDTVEPALIPVLLGGGRPLLPSPAVRRRLVLTGQRVYETGTVLLTYNVEPANEQEERR